MLKAIKLSVPILIACIAFLIIYFFGARHTDSVNSEINEFKEETEGVIVRYGISGKSLVKDIRYKYKVGSIIYEASAGLNGHQEYFESKCIEQGKTGFVGAKFVVEYSSKNPKRSRIVVGEFVWQANFGSVVVFGD